MQVLRMPRSVAEIYSTIPIALFSLLFFGPCARVAIVERTNKVDSDIKTIYEAAQAFETQTGEWPHRIPDIVLAKDANGKRIPLMLSIMPSDSWGREYLYALTREGPVIMCFGEDGAPGGRGVDRDRFYPRYPNDDPPNKDSILVPGTLLIVVVSLLVGIVAGLSLRRGRRLPQ